MTTNNISKTNILEKICMALLIGDNTRAGSLVRSGYPFRNPSKVSRNCSVHDAMNLFLRDGFIDRYSGQRLVFIGVLRLLSFRLPVEFPYHTNWKMSECHVAYYELCPTIDHVIPIARGGTHKELDWVNCVTTSMLRNSAKANWTPEELGWSLVPRGNLTVWDGLIHLYIELFESDQKLKENKNLLLWYKAAQRALSEQANLFVG